MENHVIHPEKLDRTRQLSRKKQLGFLAQENEQILFLPRRDHCLHVVDDKPQHYDGQEAVVPVEVVVDLGGVGHRLEDAVHQQEPEHKVNAEERNEPAIIKRI